MLKTLWQRVIQTFKEFGMTNEEVENAFKESKDLIKHFKFSDQSKADEIMDALDEELGKLGDKKDGT